MKIKLFFKKDYLYYVYLQRFLLYVNTDIFLPTCLMKIMIVKVKMYSFYLKESSNDKLKKHDRVLACLGMGGNRQKITLHKSSYTKFW